MKNAALAVTVFLLAGASTYAVFEETEHVSQTVSLDPGGTVVLKSFSGRVNITGSEGRDVVVDAVRRADRDRLDRIKLEVHKDGNTVVVDANHRVESSWWNRHHNNVVETDFDIKVPRRANLDINVFSAPVTVDGVEGTHDVHTFSGRVRLNDVAGSVRAKTFSGSVELRAKNWAEGQTIDVKTFSGNVALHVPDAARGTINFNSFSGHLNSDIPLVFRSSSRRSITAELGSGQGGSLHFQTFSGSVRIDR